MAENNKGENRKFFDTIIVSDIHLGSFVSRSKEVVETLSSLKFKRLILLGDILDDLNFHRFKDNHWLFFTYIKKIISKKDVEVVWVFGNHDKILGRFHSFLGIPIVNEYRWKYNGKKCLAIHGHQFDRFMKENKFISNLAAKVYYSIQKIDPKQRLARFLKRTSKKWLRVSKEVSEGAVNYARKNNVDIIICGHTHRSSHKRVKEIEYFNSGCWTDIPSTFISINKEIKIHKVH